MIVRKDIPLRPLIRGGGQEKGRRAGTLNTAAIVGFGAALEQALSEDWSTSEKNRDFLEKTLREHIPDAIIYGDEAPRLPNTTLVRLPGLSNELQLMHLDLQGYAVSAGSACSSGKISPSPVLSAMGVPEAHTRESIRISLGASTPQEDIVGFLDILINFYQRSSKKCPL